MNNDREHQDHKRQAKELNETALAGAVESFCGKYPMRRSALMPALHLAQQQQGYITSEAMIFIGKLLDLTPVQIYEVASFYDHFHTQPIGRCQIQICTNISCMLAGAEQLLSQSAEQLNLPTGHTSTDGVFTLTKVECLGACDKAPVVQLNNQPYLEKVSAVDLAQLLDRLSQEHSYQGQLNSSTEQIIQVRNV